VVSLRTATPKGDCFSVAVASQGQYGAPEGLQFGFPVQADGKGGWSVVEGFARDGFATERIGITTDELLAERNDVKELGLIG
jgi:malate dehydrogenase